MSGTDEKVQAFLEHFGVKGMKWGVRKDVPPSIRKLKNKDVPGHTREQVRTARNQIGQEAVNDFNANSVPKINKKWEKVDLNNEKNLRGYQLDMVNTLSSHVDKAAKNYGEKFFEGVHFEAAFQGTQMHIYVVDDIKHAETDPFLVFDVITDSDGRIVEIVMKDLEHGDKVEAFLEHYGVKGMKWGVRRFGKKRSSAPSYSDEGSEARQILTKAKDSGIGSLTNHELRVVNARIKLEQDFHKLNPKPKSKLEKGADIMDKMIKVYDAVDKADTIFRRSKDKLEKGKKLMTAPAKAATP